MRRVVDHAAALARLLRLLESARPADARAVVSALPEADLAAAVEAAQGRISLAVREYILDEGPPAALIALSRQAVLGRVEEPYDVADRVLLRFDPAADAAFFEPTPTEYMVRKARTTILRDRKGPDGRAVIPPSVKQSLLDSVAATSAPDRVLLDDLAGADDPDLVLAVLPYADRLAAREAARAIITLDAYGLRAEAKRHRRLWAGRGRAFTVLGHRRFGAVAASHSRDTVFGRTPNAHLVNPLSLDQYRALVEESQSPRDPTYAQMRAMARASLRAGTLSPAEVLEHTRPAAAAVSLAVCEDDEDVRPGERRAADDMRTLIAQTANAHLGDDVKRWAHAVTWVNAYRGTLLELLAGPIADRDRRFADDHGSRITELDARNMLLASAPHDIATRVLVTKNMKRTINALAAQVPLCRPLVEHIVTRGTVPQREALAANEATPDSVLHRLLDKAQFTNIPFAIMERDEVGPEVLSRALSTAPRGQKLREWMVENAGYNTREILAALRGMADDPAWLLSLLRDIIEEVDEPEETATYALLADIVGVEAVWALDLYRSGTLEYMEPYVRESMATGDAEPIFAAARATPIPDEVLEPDDTRWPRTEDALDHPLNRPLETLVRSRLDGHVERWLELADRLAARPEASDAELIGEFAPTSDTGGNRSAHSAG